MSTKLTSETCIIRSLHLGYFEMTKISYYRKVFVIGRILINILNIYLKKRPSWQQKKNAKRIRTERLGANKWTVVMHSYGFCWTTKRVLVFNNALCIQLMDRSFSQENHNYRLVYKTTRRTVHYIWFTICTVQTMANCLLNSNRSVFWTVERLISQLWPHISQFLIDKMKG